MSEMKVYRLRALPFGKGACSREESSGSRRGRQSEGDARAETPLARLVRASRACDETKGAVTNIGLWIREVRVVGRVQRLCTELKLDFLRDRERAVDAHIRLKETRPTKVISAAASKARTRLCCPGTI